MVKREKEKRRYSAAGNLWYVLQGLRRYSHYWLFWCGVNTLFGTVLPFIAVFLPKLLIDELTGLQRVPVFTTLLLGSAGATIVCSILVQAGANYQWPHSALLRCRLMLLRGNKAMAIDYKLTEDADFLSKFEKARKATGERVNTERDSLMEYCNAIYFAPSYILAFAGYSVIIFTLHPLILALLIAGLLVSYRIGVWYDKLEYQSMERRGEYFKGMRYYSERFIDLKIAKDVRLFGLNRLIMAKYLYYSYKNFDVSKELMVKRLCQYLVEFLTDFLRDSIVVGYIIYSALNKNMPVGDMFMYFLSVNNLAGSLKQIIDSVVNMRRIDPYISDLREFFDIREDHAASAGKPLSAIGQYMIQFCDVSFRYPGSEKWLLRNFSLTIQAHEKIALVGLNGAGKTTLVKLMTRLYEPDEGVIRLNGTDIRVFSKTAYYALFSVLFQDYALFAFTVAENISMRDRAHTDMERVRNAIEKVGLKDKIDELPHGINTYLLRQLEDEGVELSGGQSQRLALARAIYKDGEIVVLDEPTAALDPLAEFDIYSKFSELVRDKTTVFVSHRLSSTRFCDRVLLLEEGRIAEEGTHEELMAMNGHYTDIFKKQAHYYKENPDEQEGGVVDA